MEPRLTAQKYESSFLQQAHVPEIAVSSWWRFANLNDPLVMTDDRPAHVVFRGVWSHGLGPDFAGAMIALEDGQLLSGSIEIHRAASDWAAHGHDRDPAYNDVILHLVLLDDGVPTRRADGGIVPVVVLPEPAAGFQQAFSSSAVWSMVGGAVCAETIAAERPDLIRQALWELGDRRLAVKSARLEARLSSAQPAAVLYQELLAALGYSANREAMQALASTVPVHALISILSTVGAEDRELLAMAILLGAGGFLPMSPQHADAASLSPASVSAIEASWEMRGTAWASTRLAPSAWKLTRVRPANHPVRRILAAALILARTQGGLVFEGIEAIRAGTGLDQRLVDWATWDGTRMIGQGRAAGIVTNAFVPFAFALASHTGEDGLAEAASQYWETMSGEEPNSITRRAERQVAGAARVPGLRARGLQGLIHLDSTLCAPRRCFECPIAHLVSLELEEKQAGAFGQPGVALG